MIHHKARVISLDSTFANGKRFYFKNIADIIDFNQIIQYAFLKKLIALNILSRYIT